VGAYACVCVCVLCNDIVRYDLKRKAVLEPVSV